MKKEINNQYVARARLFVFVAVVLLLPFLTFPHLLLAIDVGGRAGIPSGGSGSPCYSSSECGGGVCQTNGFCLGGSAIGGGYSTPGGSGGAYTANYTATYTPTDVGTGVRCHLSVIVDQTTGNVSIKGIVGNHLTDSSPDFTPYIYIHIWDNTNSVGYDNHVDAKLANLTDSYSNHFANGSYTANIYGEGTGWSGGSATFDSCATSTPFSVSAVPLLPDLTAYGVSVNPSENDTTYWSVNVGTPEIFNAWIKNVGGGATPGSFPYFFQVAKGDYTDDGNITNLTYNMTTQLNSFQMTQVLSPSYFFPSAGSYYVRVCANMCPYGTSSCPPLVDEGSNPTGNCGDWTPVTVIAPPSTDSAPFVFSGTVASACLPPTGGGSGGGSGGTNIITVTKDVSYGGIITDSNGNTCSASVNPCVTSVNSGDNLTLTATPSSSLWVFSEWTGDGSCSGTISTCVLNDIQSNKNVIAKFTLRKTLQYFEY